MQTRFFAVVLAASASALVPASRLVAQDAAPTTWSGLEGEAGGHYPTRLRLATANPAGNEHIAADYSKQALEREGISAQTVGSDPNRSNVVARLKGNGRKRPLLVMGHTDVVTVDAAKWKFPPFSATRDGG